MMVPALGPPRPSRRLPGRPRPPRAHDLEGGGALPRPPRTPRSATCPGSTFRAWRSFRRTGGRCCSTRAARAEGRSTRPTCAPPTGPCPSASAPDARWRCPRTAASRCRSPSRRRTASTCCPSAPGRSARSVSPASSSSSGRASHRMALSLVFTGAGATGLPRVYVKPLAGGRARPVTPDGIGLTTNGIAPDGSAIVARCDSGLCVYPLDGGPARRIADSEKLAAGGLGRTERRDRAGLEHDPGAAPSAGPRHRPPHALASSWRLTIRPACAA